MSDSRALTGALIVAVLAVFGALASYQTSQTYAAQYPDAYGVARADQRFADALKLLPGSGTIGYMSDLKDSDNAGVAAFLAAQYAVAPRALAREASKAEWVLGNFAHPADFAAIGAKAGLTMVRDLGNGVIVYRRAKP